MDKLLHIGPGTLFSLTVGVSLLLSIIDINFSPSPYFSAYFVSPLIGLLYMGVFFGWIWYVRSSLYNKLSDNIEMNSVWFRSIWTVAIFSYILARVFSVSPLFGHLGISEVFNWVSIDSLLKSIFAIGILYCAFFVAKALKSVELGKAATFKGYASYMLLLFMFPIGVWYLQPRINKIFGDRKEFATED